MDKINHRRVRGSLVFVWTVALSLVLLPFLSNAATPARIAVKPGSVNFGSLKAGGTSAPVTITLSNTGDAELVINSISITGVNSSEFAQTNDCSIIPAKGSCPVSVTFSPVTPFGSKTGVMNISSGDLKRPNVTLKLSGKAPAPKISASPQSVDFGPVPMTTSSAVRTVTIKNTGISDLSISGVAITGVNLEDFNQTNNCSTIPQGSSCKVEISFTPSSHASKELATLTISSDDPQRPGLSVKLGGRGLAVIGVKFPIATLSGREMGAGAAFDGTNYLVGIQGDAYSPQGISAQLVSQSGGLVGPRISLGATCVPQPQPSCGGAPAVAFDGTNYLMVWQEDNQYSTHLYGRLISKTGVPAGPIFTVGSGTDIELVSAEDMLFDGNNYFVVWEDNAVAGESDSAHVYGQFIAQSGQLLGPPLAVTTAAHGQRFPVAVFDGTNIFVAWVDGRSQSACGPDEQGQTACYPSDIYGQLIAKSTASDPGLLSGPNFLVNAGLLPRDNPVGIAFSGTDYLITFTEETTFPGRCPHSGCLWNAYGQRATTAGAATGPKTAIGSTKSGHYVFAHPVFDGIDYLVAWTQGFGTSAVNIKGQYFDMSAVHVGSDFVINKDAGDLFGFVTGFANGRYFVLVNTGDKMDGTVGDVYGLFVAP